MATCRHCEATHPADELTRHESAGLVLVHCPDCRRLLGRYRRHGDDPETDRLQDG
jgi:NAD-dependent SIR2 family protein deacetylase